MTDISDPLAKTPVELALDAKHLQYTAETIKARLLDGTAAADLMSEFHALSLGAKRLHREAQRIAQSRKQGAAA